MEKRHIKIAIFSIITGFIVLGGCANEKLNTACFKERCFFIEISKTPEERAKGLMFRKQLDTDKGMLFIFDQENIYPFWMKNTLIPLDILWMDANYTIVFMQKNVPPCKKDICENIIPSEKAKYVLELNSGTAEKIGLKIGDVMDIRIP